MPPIMFNEHLCLQPLLKTLPVNILFTVLIWAIHISIIYQEVLQFGLHIEDTPITYKLPFILSFIQHDVAVGPTIEDTPITQATLHPSNNPVTGEPGSTQSSSGDVSIAEPNQVTQPSDHLRK
ncbi:hypothetical protein Tco_0703338 [Tanacetum coccineum]|uniref:Uncharacterized protein n=1 Tax=Tanacetum coccineum TaxID=301880 RepID=A0ABQ4Y0E4_9ASTR